MKKIILLSLLCVLISCSLALAETNGQSQANNDVVRTTSQALTTMVQGRVATIAAPKPAGIKSGGSAPSGVKLESQNAIDGNGNINLSFNAEELGLASGDGANDFGVWAMGSYTYFASTASGARYDADTYNFLLGADYKIIPDLMFGLAVGYGVLDLDKKDWNNGADTGTLKTDYEWTVMPYMAYNITDTTIFDGAFAYTNSRYKDSDGINTGKYDSDRYLTSLGVSQYFMLDNWTLSGRLGYMYVGGDLSSYSRGTADISNPDSYLSQMNLEAKAAYLINGWIEPYATLRYYYDLGVSTRPVKSDYDEFESILGLTMYATDQWTLGFEGGATVGRADYESYRGQASIRFEF
ncbi:autotransporter outer membrane beta-barrel domain-containing protein [Maridesulfovibrio zosterae]|uniref:autotransporter outer membrane beta-barrel domain-containing protein n=1 Tax=Maridesulfovibrio zosterae TaxID=82171 RepID=UPI0003FDA663|nr:autotransporter outer membrane beta-barrel domain-containing protein [Maridesulfovibrio zosterae]